MNERTFLSLSLKPWSLSLGLHALFFLSLAFIGRNHFSKLGAIDLDFAPLSKTTTTQARNPMEDDWQNPRAARKVLPIAAPSLKMEPTPVSVPVPGLVSSPGGTGSNEFRSVDQLSRLPSYKTQVKAMYTEAARNANIEGEVILQVDIDASGGVKKVELIQGLGYGLDEAAIAAIRQSTFSPAYVGEEPVPVSFQQHLRFKIEY